MRVRTSVFGFFIAFFAILTLAVAPVFAANPHFVRASASISSSGDLTVNFKEAGLGDTVTVTERASADASAEYGCINGGEKHPKAANKETVNSEVSASGPFTSGKNGSISGSLVLHAPSAGTFSCPPGQSLVLNSVTYTNVAITDVTNNVSQSIPGTFSRDLGAF